MYLFERIERRYQTKCETVTAITPAYNFLGMPTPLVFPNPKQEQKKILYTVTVISGYEKK